MIPNGAAIPIRPQQPLEGTRYLILGAGMAVLLVVLVRTAWLCDDAYITFRTADNWIHGFGLRWNVSERVQTFTHPLWLGVFSSAYAVTREAYYTAIAMGFVFTVATVAVAALALAATPSQAALYFAAVLSSKAFVDFSTSGLENPLTHLLVSVFLWRWWAEPPGPRRMRRLSFIAALCLLNRMDLAVLVGPALAMDAWRLGFRAAVLPMLCGLLPFFAWEAFSLVYYGLPFPNTAYAKLATSIPAPILFRRGISYGHAVLRSDPATIAIILLSPLTLLSLDRARDWPLVAGVACFGLYVTSIGGDFMLGRFYTPMVAMTAGLLAHAPVLRRRSAAVSVTVAILVVGFTAPDEPALVSGYHAARGNENPWWLSDIIDERQYYYRHTGLLEQRAGTLRPQHSWAEDGLKSRGGPAVVVEWSIGLKGFFAGPGVHIIDEYALGDPLLARLPVPYARGFRIGHFARPVPAGYVATVRSGTNQIEDPDLAMYYDRLRFVITAPVWSRRRLVVSTAMLLGRYDHHLRRYNQRLAASDTSR